LSRAASGYPAGADPPEAYQVTLYAGDTPIVTQTITTTHLDVGLGEDYDRVLRWRVQASNDYGWGRWTDWRTYGVDTLPPPNPTVVTETHGITNGGASLLPPAFLWPAANDGPIGSGVAGYRIYFGPAITGTPNVWLETAAYTPTLPPPGSLYYLRGYAQDVAGNQAEPSTWFSVHVLYGIYLPLVARDF
jgi:hypothetical protein